MSERPVERREPVQPGQPGLPTLPGDQRTVMTNLGGDPGTAVTKPPAGGERPPSEHSALTIVQPGAAPAHPDEVSGEIWGDFALESLLGRGGMGAVYRARQLSLDRSVAVKVLPPHLSANENFRGRFALEAKAVAQISSPHVIQVYAAGQHQGHHYFAMEFVEGVDLARKLRDGFRPTYRQALELVTQAARGLAAAGEHGIVHRDIKPANLMLTAKGQLKIMDFGLVKLASAHDGLTMAGTIMGTVSYFSPEQGRGEPCDQRTDIYAVGVVFYELLTGKLPFTGADATSVIYQHIHTPPRAPKEIDPQIPEDYQAVVLKCLQKDARDRYQTADALLEDLEHLAEGRKPQTAYVDPASLRSGATILKTPAFRGEAKRRRWPVVLLSLVALALIGVLAADQAGLLRDGRWRQPFAHLSLTRAHEVARAAVGDPAGDLEAARKLLADRLYDQARRAVERERAARPDDERWAQLARDLDVREGREALGEAEAAAARGDDAAAWTAIQRAGQLIPSDPRFCEAQARIVERQGKRAARQKTIDQIQALLSGNDAAKADAAAAALAAEWPKDEEVVALAQRARTAHEDADARAKAVSDQLDQADQALVRQDLDGALLAYTAARQLDPRSARAAAGLDKVESRKQAIAAIRGEFQEAIAAKDLARAQKQLERLRVEAPGSAVVVLAENELANSKLVEDAERAKAEARDADAKRAAAAAIALAGDVAKPVDAVQRAADDFARAWPDRPEVARVRAALDDRIARDACVAMLAKLDAAVLAKDRATVRALVHDADFAARLDELMAMDGLAFRTTAGAFTRDRADAATVAVDVRTALPTFPETVLPAVYGLAHGADGWAIATAKLSEPKAP